MGAVRHRELIRVLALVVALEMAVGVVALAVRSDDRHAPATRILGGSIPIPVSTDDGGSILAGGSFTRRRGANGADSARTTAPLATGAASAAAPTATQPPPSTSRPPETTTSTLRDAANTTSRLRSPGSTTTSRPAPAGNTTSSSRSPGTTAPKATTATSGPGAAPSQEHGVRVTDPAGDTVVDGSQDPIKEPRADIVRAGALYRAGSITFAMQVQQPTDPRTDARWAGESTFASWSVDTTGDGTPDYEIQYSVDQGQLGGTVSRPNEGTDVVCDDTEAAYDSDTYAVTVNPACLGNPASFAYSLTLYYDTNPKDENADVASDVAPNGGLSFPVKRPG